MGGAAGAVIAASGAGKRAVRSGMVCFMVSGSNVRLRALLGLRFSLLHVFALTG
jgi:hypothetical protein